MNSEDSMSARRSIVKVMLSNCSVKLTFEQTVKGLILGVTYVLGKTFDGNTTSVIISDTQLRAIKAIHDFAGDDLQRAYSRA